MKRTFLSVTVMVAAIALFATAALAATIACTGGPCDGTPNRDTITGSISRDLIAAGAGVDTVDALGGRDEVGLGRGGTPFDMEFVEGGAGNDELRGGRGSDELDDFQPSGIDDTDLLIGGRNDDSLFAEDGDGNDTLDGGPGADDCFGDPGDKYVRCNNASD